MPAKTKEAPVKTKEAPVKTKEAPVKTKEAPVKTKEAPAKAKEAPAKAKEAPAKTKEASAKTKEASAKTKEAPAKTKEAPAKTKGASAKTKGASAKKGTSVEEEGSAGEEERPKSPFASEIALFAERVIGLRMMAPFLMGSLQRLGEKLGSNIDERLRKYQLSPDEVPHALRLHFASEQDSISNEGPETYRLPLAEGWRVLRSLRLANRVNTVMESASRMFLVSLVSEYDSFLGKFIKVMVKADPGLISASGKQIELSRLMNFSSIEEAVEFFLEKEIESVLRESHIKQLDWLSGKIDASLKPKPEEVWARFVELTERRNLFVHNHGVVNRQYLKSCATHKVPISEKMKLGEQLDVDQSYFEAACDCTVEIGALLGQVIWRQLAPGQSKEATDALISLCYDLIEDKQYRLAIRLGEFGLSRECRKTANDQQVLVLKINIAQSYKWMGAMDECQKVLDRIDWTAVPNVYHLGRAVLLDDFDLAAKLMRKLGRDTQEVSERAYITWPLFHRFRDSDVFAAAFEEIYGHEPYMSHDSVADGRISIAHRVQKGLGKK